MEDKALPAVIGAILLKSDRYARFNVENLQIVQWLTRLHSCEWMCRYGQVFAESVPSLRSRPSSELHEKRAGWSPAGFDC